MTNIISAKEAYKHSTYQKKVDEILKTLAEDISRAIDSGKYKTGLTIDINTPAMVREMLTEELEKKGYTVEITKHEEDNRKMGSRSIDQGYYFDNINISWEDAK